MANPKDLIYKSERSLRSPQRFLTVGSVFSWKGKTYEVVRRGKFVLPCDCCSGCAFANVNCPDTVACSRYDRSDDTPVWFIEK